MEKIRAIFVFGLIWGILEASLGLFLHLIHLPAKGYIMGSIGISIMALAVTRYRAPYVACGIGVIAAVVKLLDIVVLPQSMWGMVMRPAIAILLESLAFCLISTPVFYLYARKTAEQRIWLGPKK